MKQMLQPDNEHLAMQLKDLFHNILLGPEAPDEYWSLEGCILKEDIMTNSDELVLSINGIKMDPDFNLLRADPFYIIREEKTNEMIKPKTELCISEYVGPQYIVFNRKTKCFREIPYNPIGDHQTLLLFHSELCKTPIKTANVKWRQVKCESLETLIPEEVVQLKWDHDFVYYYCYSQNLTIGEHPTPCLNQIYKQKRGTNISINGQTVLVQSFRLGTLSVLETDVSDYVNEKVFDPDKSDISLKNLETLIDVENKLLSRIAASYISKTMSYFMTAGGIIIVVLVVSYIAYIIYRYKKIKKHRAREYRETTRRLDGQKEYRGTFDMLCY